MLLWFLLVSFWQKFHCNTKFIQYGLCNYDRSLTRFPCYCSFCFTFMQLHRYMQEFVIVELLVRVSSNVLRHVLQNGNWKLKATNLVFLLAGSQLQFVFSFMMQLVKYRKQFANIKILYMEKIILCFPPIQSKGTCNSRSSTAISWDSLFVEGKLHAPTNVTKLYRKAQGTIRVVFLVWPCLFWVKYIKLAIKHALQKHDCSVGFLVFHKGT